MKKLFIPAILAAGMMPSVVAIESNCSNAAMSDTILFVEKIIYSDIQDGVAIDFNNLNGYKTMEDALNDENGQLIGIQCYVELPFTMVDDNTVKRFAILKKECQGQEWFVRKNSDKDVEAVMISNVLPYSIESVDEGSIGCDSAWMKGANLGIEGQLRFIAENPTHWWIYKLRIANLSEQARWNVYMAETITKYLKNKKEYSNADKVALYIAFELVRRAFDSKN